MLRRTSGIILPKSHVLYESIVTDLNRVVETFNGDLETICFYEELENEDSILIPRYYPIDEPIEDCSDEGEDIQIEHNIKPRNNRQKISMDFFKNNDHGVLRLEPGSGKTVLAIWTIATHKKKTIIFAHKDKLLDQWAQEILEFTDLKEDDIIRLRGDNYKKAFTEAKIILSTPQIISYALKNGKTEFLEGLKNANIGVMFVDECHVGVGPEQFSKSSLFVKAKRTYGLSATPSRSDGTSDIIHYHLGEVTYFKPEDNELANPMIYMLKFPFKVWSRHRKYISWGGKFNLSRYYQQLYKAEKYNRILGNWINKAYQEGRVVLVLGVNIKALLELAKASKIPKEHLGFFTPSNKRKDIKKKVEEITDTYDLEESFRKKQVVFSTYGACRDGNNRVEFDFLVMAAPTSNPEQAIGRVCRMKEGKKRPIIIDAVDTEGPEVPAKSENGKLRKVPWFIRSAEKRERFYVSKEWTIKKLSSKN